MKLFLKILILFSVATILQQTFPSWGIFGGLKPPIFISIMLYASFRLPNNLAWITSILSSFFYDALEPGPYGPAVISYPFLTFLILRFRKNLFHEGLITQIFCGALSGMVSVCCAIFIYVITNARPLDFVTLKIISSIFLGAITFPLCSKFLLDIIPSQERGGHI